MKSDSIFVADIKKCTSYDTTNLFCCEEYINGKLVGRSGFGYITHEGEVIKKDAILINLKNGGYVDIDSLNGVVDVVKTLKDMRRRGFVTGGKIMSTSPSRVGSVYVCTDSLRPYNSKEKEVSILQLKRDRK